jgi:hypothetical protein
MNVTPAMIKAKLMVIISSRSENPLFFRDAIRSLPVDNLVSSRDVKFTPPRAKLSKDSTG